MLGIVGLFSEEVDDKGKKKCSRPGTTEQDLEQECFVEE